MMRFHHIGVACGDIAEEIDRLSRLHEVVACTPLVHDPEQDAVVALLTLADGSRLELVTGPQVESLVKKHVGFYHICFEVGDLDGEIDRMVEQGARLIVPPRPAILFHYRKVAFLYVSYGLIELLSQNEA